MWAIRKSDTFKAQLRLYAQDYKERAGKEIARQFIRDVDHAITFITDNPFACGLYVEAAHHDDLRDFEFRKWSLKRFPHLILFRLEESTIILQAIYAGRMHIMERFAQERDT